MPECWRVTLGACRSCWGEVHSHRLREIGSQGEVLNSTSNEAKYLEVCILIFISLPKHRSGVSLRLMHFFLIGFFHSHLFVGTTKTTIATVASTRFVLSLHDWRDAEMVKPLNGEMVKPVGWQRHDPTFEWCMLNLRFCWYASPSPWIDCYTLGGSAGRLGLRVQESIRIHWKMVGPTTLKARNLEWTW